MVISTVHFNKKQLEKVDMLCQLKRVSRSRFIRECLDLGLNKVKASQHRGYVYLIKADMMAGVKLGKTKNLEETMEMYWNKRKMPGKKTRLHLIEASNMNKAERLLINYWEEQGKRMDKTEFFNFTDQDIKWFQNEEYLNIPEIQEAIEF